MALYFSCSVGENLFYDWSGVFLFTLGWSQVSNLQTLATVSSGLTQTTKPYSVLLKMKKLLQAEM